MTDLPPPPGYVAYGGPGDQSRGYQRIGGIAKAVVILQAIAALSAAVVLALQLGLAGDAQDFLDEVITESTFEDRIATFGLLSLLSGAVSIAVLVLLIIWSFRIAGNLQRMGRAPIVWKPGLTIVVWILGGCTLNIINFLMLREHWKGSDPETPPGDDGWRRRPIPALIVVWFVLSLGQVAVGVASGIQAFGGVRFGASTESLAESLSDRMPLILAAGLLGLASAITLILIVRQLTARHVAATGEA